MPATPRAIVTSFLAAIGLFAQNPCTAPGAPRSLSGLWKYDDPRVPTPDLQNLYLIQAPDGSVKGAFMGVPPFHSNQTGTFQGGTFNAATNQFTATLNVEEPQLDAAGKPTGKFVTGTGPVKMTLSADGNTLTGTYDETFQAPGGAPIHQTVPLSWPRQTGWPALSPATVMLAGSLAGDTVIDNSLTLTNCGKGIIMWNATAGAIWLTVSPTTASLAPAGSQTLTLKVDSSKLTPSPGPFSADLTVAATISTPGGLGTITAKSTVQIAIASLSLSDVGPVPGAELETDTDLRFGANITYGLSAGQAADITLELVDAANTGTILTSSTPLHATQAGTFRTAFLIPPFQIKQGVEKVRLRAVMKPSSSGGPVTVYGGEYTVYPRAEITVTPLSTELWSGSPANVKAGVSYIPGAPGRSKVTVQFLKSDGSLAAPEIVRSLSPGQSVFPISLTDVSLPEGDVQIRAVLGGTSTTDDIKSALQTISVVPPPANINLALGTGIENFKFDQSLLFVYPNQPIKSTDGNLPALAFNFQYAGQALLRMQLYAPGGKFVESRPFNPNLPFSLANLPYFGIDEAIAGGTGSVLTLTVKISNDAGQSVTASVDLPVNTFEITDSSRSGMPPTYSATIQCSLGPAGPARLEAHLIVNPSAAQASSPVICNSTLQPGSSNNLPCTVAPDPPAPPGSAVTVRYLLIDSRTGLLLTSASADYSNPQSVIIPAGPSLQNLPPSTLNVLTNASDLTIDTATYPNDILGATVDAFTTESRRNSRAASAVSNYGTPVSAATLAGIGLTQGFSPAVPDDGSFVSQMTMSYAPDLLPDVPGFSEANLQLVSFNPATRVLLAYPSTVDTAAKTVTASIGGLYPYYSLAVPSSTLGAQFAVALPSTSTGTLAGLGLFNTAFTDAVVNLSAHDFAGATMGDTVPVGIRAGQGASGAFSDVVPGSLPPGGWLEATSASNSIRGVAVLGGSGDLEAVPLASSVVSAVLTNIQADDQNSTEVHIANPTPFDNRITLELHGTTGEVLDQFQVRLGPKANFSGTVRSMFHNAPLPVAGYIIVRGTQLLSTATLTRVDRALSALIGQPLDPGAADPLKLYAAYFETGGPSRTDIVLVNLAANPVQVVIRAFNLAGAQVGRQVAVTLAARAQYRAELGQALGFNTDAMTTGSLVVDTLAGVLGDVTIGDSEAPVLRRTSFALTGVPSKSMVIPHVISANSLGMTVYAVNTGTSRATATLKVIRPDGAVVQTSTFSIPPAGSASQPVPAGQIGGAILLDSDQPLASLGLVSPGSLLSDIAAIGAQTR